MTAMTGKYGVDRQVVDVARFCSQTSGYQATVSSSLDLPDLTTDEYAEEQLRLNEKKLLDFVLPLIRASGASRVLDVGCGIGRMVMALETAGFEGYGVDLSGLQGRWKDGSLSPARFFVVGPEHLSLPFRDCSLDFVFSLGVIEHVGTTDGHADRAVDYHERRAQWTREIFRVLAPGGQMLLAGPNRTFPIDVAHGLDSRASQWEKTVSRWLGASLHKTWGDNFLWGYADLQRYLAGLECSIQPVSVANYLHFSRVPASVRGLVRFYVRHLPQFLLGTWMNPWMAALVTKARKPG